jgi:hypothetical protein
MGSVAEALRAVGALTAIPIDAAQTIAQLQTLSGSPYTVSLGPAPLGGSFELTLLQSDAISATLTLARCDNHLGDGWRHHFSHRL